MPVMRIEILSKRMNEFNSYKRTHFLSLSRTLESGVPIMSCILAIWSTSFEPGKRGWRLKETKYMYETIYYTQYPVPTWITFTVRFGSHSIIQSKIMIPKKYFTVSSSDFILNMQIFRIQLILMKYFTRFCAKYSLRKEENAFT